MRGLIWSLLGLNVALVAACHQTPVPTSAAPRQAALAARSAAADLYPVTAGSRWDYDLHQRQANGDVQIRPMSVAITSAKTRADGAIEAITERQYQNWSPPATRVLKFADRVVLARASDPEDGPSITILKLPVTPGASWPGRPLGGGHLETIRTIGSEAVTVPAGTFRATRVDHEIAYATGDGDTLNYWYAPGVGVVKMIERTTLYQEGQPVRLQVTGELKSYVIGKGSHGN